MLLLVLLLGSARAANLSVDAAGGAAYTSIQQAIAAASSGDSIDVAPGSYAEALDLLGKSLTITGTDGPESTVLDATGNSWAVLLQRGEQDVSISGLTVRNDGARGVYADNSSLLLSDMAFDALGAETLDGGAVYGSGSDISIDSSSFDEGIARYGGQIYVSGGSLHLSDSVLDNGSATRGGAVYASGSTVSLSGVELTYASATEIGGGLLLTSSPASIEDSSFQGNSTDAGHGPAIHALYADLSLVRSSFQDNHCEDYTAGYYGGAVYAGFMDQLLVEDSDFDSNTNYYGGAVFVDQAAATVTGSSFSNNWSYYGGSAFMQYGSWTETGTTHSENTGYYGAGALYPAYSSVDIRGSSFQGNIATYGHGGAFYAYAYADVSVDLSDTSFTDNYAYYGGGAVYLVGVYEGTTVTRCSFEDNQGLYANGGAIRSYYYAPLAISDSTFDGNLSETDGGAISAEYNSSLSLDAVDLVDNQSGSTGGAVNFLAYAATPLQVSDSRFEGNSARSEGGALRATVADLDLDRVDFIGNTADETGFGGALRLNGLSTGHLSQVRVEGNSATYGGGLYVDASASIVATNTVVASNSAQHGGGLAVVQTEALGLINVVLVGNHAEDTGSAVYQYQAPVVLDNTIVAWQTGSAAVYAGSSMDKDSSDIIWSVFWENSAGHGGGAWADSTVPGVDTVELDPGFARSPTDSGANMVLARDSEILDLGDPDLVDLDGSRSDPGAWGGSSLAVQDADGDGADSSVDCDDDDATVHPGASETWYDGADQDCLLVSDYDADGDGAESMDYGGDDCDDSDPTVIDCPDDEGSDTGGQQEDPGDGAGPGPDGGVDGEDGDSKGCTTAPGGGGLLLGFLAGLTTRRRRRTERR